MKKWILHTGACILNALATTTFLSIMLYETLGDLKGFESDGILYFILVLLVYFIYIIADYWGIKLFYRYKNKGTLSFSDRGKISAILFFHCIVQLITGYLVIKILPLLFSDATNPKDEGAFIRILLFTTFVTAVIIFITTILLMKAIKVNQLIIKKEIDDIGVQQPDLL
jgi:Kef-type K+ transport system membrane component KefB